jgi:hypothetical protein
MTRDYPSVAEIREIAEEIAELAARLRMSHELRLVSEGDSTAVRHLSDNWAKERGAYAWIPDAFVSRIGPEPSSFEPLISSMENAWKAIYDKDSGEERVGSHVRVVESHLSNWSGLTAEAFRVNFLSKIPDSAKNQAQVAFMLQHAMLTDQDVHIEHRRNLKELGNKVKIALEATKCYGADEAIVVLTVVGIVASAIALFPGATIACTIIASTASAAALAAGAVEKPVESDVAADTVDGIVSNMNEAFRKLDEQLFWAERKIITALRDNRYLLTDTTHRSGVASSRAGFLPPRPALVGESMIPSFIRSDFVPS